MGLLHKSLDGLDGLFEEDIEREPVGYAFLVVASAGRGKTTLGYQMMYDYIKKTRSQEFGIYITFEQSAKRLREQFKRLQTFEQNPGIIIIDAPLIKQITDGKLRETEKKIKEVE